MNQAISNTSTPSLASELAALIIENEANQADSAKQDREAARASFLDNAQHQVDALHDAASATMTGALVGAAYSIAGDACQIGSASAQYDLAMGSANGASSPELASDKLNANMLSDLGNVYSHLAEANKAIGDSTAAGCQAEAKRYETRAAQAKWQADDASTTIDKADKRGDKSLELLQSMQQDDHSSASAIIGRI